MDTIRLIMRRAAASAKTAIAAGVGIGLLAASASAQSGAGTIRGRVLNETTGEYLEGAVVQVVGSGQSASTNLQGYFELRGVPEGAADVRVSYLGLGDKMTSVQVSSEVAKVVELSLSEDLVELDGVRVESSLTGRSAAINQQRVASGIKNIVNKDDFGQMNDGNIGMALRRMPGLSVDTDGGTEVPRYVNIRGFDASLNSVTLDGNRLASSESGSPSQRGGGTAYSGAARAFALDDLSADAITNVEIVKSPTPDMEGAALGGSVNMVTRSAFERNGRSIDYRLAGSYSELRGEFGFNGGLTYSDLLNAFGGDRNLGVSITTSHYSQNEGFDNVDYDWNYLSTSFDPVDLSGVASDGALNDYLEPQLAEDRERTGKLAIAVNEDTEYNNFQIDRKRTGFSAAFELKLNDNTELYFKPTVNHEDRNNVDLRHHLIMDSSDRSEGLNHGEAADPINQWVSLYGASESGFNAGNYAAFRSAVIAAGRQSEQFVAGDTVNGVTFNPGALVRLGADPTHISTIRPGSGDEAAGTTYDPDGSARGKVRYEGTFRDEEIDFVNLNLGGKTSTVWGEVRYGAYTSTNEKAAVEYQHEYERRGFQFAYTRDSEDPYIPNYMTVNNVSRFEIPDQNAVDRFRDLDLEYKHADSKQEFIGFNADVDYNLASSDQFTGKLRGGIRWTQTDFSYDYDEAEWDLASSFPYADYLYMNELDGPYGAENMKIPYVPDAPRIYNEALQNNPQWFSEQYDNNLNDSIIQDYTATESTLAYYFMGDLTFGKLNVIVGARMEHNEFETESFVLSHEITEAEATGVDTFTADERAFADGVQTQDRSYDQFLPSLHLKYGFTDNVIGRMSIGRTYAKPAIKDMVGSIFIEEDGGTYLVDIPNFNLPPQESKNFDMSIEYYREAGRFGIGYFKKDMTNYAWNETYETFNYPGLEGFEAVVSQPIANTNAINQGVEFFFDQKLTFLPEVFHAFSLMGSYTYTDSDARYYTGRVGPTIGHSKNMYTLSLAYTEGPLFARAIWQYRSPYFENISISDFAEESEALAPENQFLFDDTFMNPGTLDLEFGYKFSERIEFFSNVTNVMEGINASRQGYFANPEDSYPHKRRWTFGIKGRF